MRLFSMPADFRAETIDAYARLHQEYPDSRVADTYGSITTKGHFGSGRNIDKIPPVDFERLADYVAHSRRNGILFSYTLNPSFMQNREFTPDGVRQMRIFLTRLRDVGVDNLIVAMPSLIELLHELDLDFRIKASVICQITSANKARYFQQMGVDSICIDETINRDFAALRRIREAFGDDVQVIANSVCHQDCQYRMFHYNQISGDSVDATHPVSGNYFTTRCLMRLYDDVTNMFKTTWIRPEDLHYYTDIGIRRFKLQGRQTVLLGDPLRAVEHYFQGRFDGVLKDLLFLFAPSEAYKLSVENRLLDGFLRPFAEVDGFCKRDCHTCRYCENFARKCLDLPAAAELGRTINERIRRADPFRSMVSETGKTRDENEPPSPADA